MVSSLGSTPSVLPNTGQVPLASLSHRFPLVEWELEYLLIGLLWGLKELIRYTV